MNRIIFVAAFFLLLSFKGKCHFMNSDYTSDSIPYPWSEVDLTAAEAKVLDAAPVVEDGAFPWIPVIIGTAAVGTAVYFLTKEGDDDDPGDCSFAASAIPGASTCGLSNGNIALTINPPGSYAYVWSNGAVTPILANIPAGDYSATITRVGTTCTQVVNATVNNINQPITLDVVTQDAACGMDNGAVTISVFPPANYTYAWSNGSTQQNQNNLAPGNYMLTITSVGTCMEDYTISVGELPPSFDISFQSSSASCGLSDGSVIAIAAPKNEYEYVWSNGQTGAQAENLSAGSYTVTVSIAGTNCSKEASVTVDELPASFSVSVTSTTAGCGLSDGTAMANVDPPGTYEYAWSNGQTSAQISDLAAGAYTVTVTVPGSDCSKEASVTVEELPASFTVLVTPTNAGCGLSDGTAMATVDPPGTYDYVWSNGQTGSQISGLAAGDYMVTVSVPGSDCSKEASVTIGADPFPYNVSLTSTPSQCGATNGSVNVIVDPQGELGYQWSNGATGAQLSGVGAGSYTVTVTDLVTSCAETFTVIVDEVPAEITLSFTTTPAGCGISNGTATVMADPPASYTYLWSNGQTTPQLSSVSSGTYSVTVTIMGTTCSTSSSVDVEQAGGGFTATFTTENADCGYTNGSATIVMDPPGEYTYQWTNNQTGSTLQQVLAGAYSVTVTDMNACTEVFSVEIAEDPAAYITNVTSVPGTCLGGGDISFVLESSAGGPVHGDVTGPTGNLSFSYSPGSYQLSAIANIVPGTYTITVYDETIGQQCSQTVMVTVDDNTPPLEVTDDFYTTPAGQALIQNALDNDAGLDIQMTGIADEFGGTVTFTADGDFTFVPDPGFSGEASFTYTVQDGCGNISTAIVTITVEQAICDFNAEFETTNASCGLEDGAITVDVVEPGTYEYAWSNGDSGPSINALAAGTYTVTITDVNLGCDLDFTVGLAENPAEYIEDVFITQPACGVDGEIRFTGNTNSGNQLILTITHPNGTDQFLVDPGDIFLSDYISVTPGDYLVEVSDEGAGGDCVESFEATLIAAPMLEIMTEAVIPPSEPTAMDGIAIIIATIPGTLPYEILLNGSSWGLALDNAFQVTGLGVGTYMIQIVDATGCVSNVLNVLIPPPPITMSFGTSMMQTVVDASNDEPVSQEPISLWRSMVTSSVEYYIGNVRQEVIARYAVPVAGYPGFAEVVCLTDIGRYSLNRFGFDLQGGIGSHFEKQEGSTAHTFAQPNYVLLKASGGYTLAKRFRFYGSVEWRGWEKLEVPRVDIGLSISVRK